jgi:hypothetical protein
VIIWHEDFPGDWVDGTSQMILYTRIERSGTVEETRDDWRLRVYSPWELSVLMRTQEGWNLDGFYSWKDGSSRIADDDNYLMAIQAV